MATRYAGRDIEIKIRIVDLYQYRCTVIIPSRRWHVTIGASEVEKRTFAEDDAALYDSIARGACGAIWGDDNEPGHEELGNALAACQRNLDDIRVYRRRDASEF